MLTFLLIAPGIALLAAYVWTKEDAAKGNTAVVLRKLIFALGIYLIVSGFIAARKIPSTPPPYAQQQFGSPPPGYLPPQP